MVLTSCNLSITRELKPSLSEFHPRNSTPKHFSYIGQIKQLQQDDYNKTVGVILPSDSLNVLHRSFSNRVERETNLKRDG